MSRRRLLGTASANAALWLLWIPGPRSASADGSQPSPEPSHAYAECIGCHGNPNIMAATGEDRPGLYVHRETIAGSVHSSFSCVTCHSALTATMHAKRDAARASCAGCHRDEAESWSEGKHAQAEQEAGVRVTCVTCHGNHAIQPADSEAFQTRMASTCARCHDEMSDRFFGGNPFGMETHLGRVDVAACWDCHGSHRVLPTEDVRSPVNRANILTTCRQCHTDAPDNFADIKIHVASSPIPEDPRLRVVTLYMLAILIFTFGFFGYHTVLQIRHELERRARRREIGGHA
jgi:hypothetical protein